MGTVHLQGTSAGQPSERKHKDLVRVAAMKGVDSVYGNGSAQYIGKAIEAFYMR